MDLLTNLRTWTADRTSDTRTDFDDLPRGHFSAAKRTGMTRIVEGADDLAYTGPRNQNPGMITTPDVTTAPPVGHDSNFQCDNPRCCPTAEGFPNDARSVGQIDLMKSLLEQLMELDSNGPTFAAALEYTSRMTVNGRWTAGRTGNASAWIVRMIAKVRELRGTARVATPTTNADDRFQDVPNGYYAVADAGPDDIHYFRISRFRDGGIKVQEQASDTLHPVRRGARRTAILTTIQTVGPASAAALYGQTLGRCGRCNRTLTDSLSRSRGIGPDCWGKM